MHPFCPASETNVHARLRLRLMETFRVIIRLRVSAPVRSEDLGVVFAML